MITQDVADAQLQSLPSKNRPLDIFLAPETVAIFGATEAPNSAGRTLMANLIRNPFGGTLFPINPRRKAVLGVKAFPTLEAVPWPIELAIIATPAPTVPDIIGECAAAGVKGAIILTVGFGERDPAWADLDRQIHLHNGLLRVLGPNSIGVACPRTGFNATFASAMVPGGNVGFLSQSGAILTGLLSKERSKSFGCSAFISVGSLLDISWAEWIDYLAEDPHSECLGIYVESLQDARSFFSAIRRISPRKPVILVKGGGIGSRGDLSGEVFEEACRLNGVLLVSKIGDLFRMAEILTNQPTPKGPCVTIVTNTRSLGLLAAKAVHAEGGNLTPLAPETVAQLGEVLTTRWNQQNPIDVGDDADADRFIQAASIAEADPNTDALLAVLTPHATIEPLQTAEHMRRLAGRKLILACWMWGAGDATCLKILQEAGIPVFRSPETAVRALGYLNRHRDNLLCLSENSRVIVDAADSTGTRNVASEIIFAARRAGRTVLSEIEQQQLLSAYGLPILETYFAGNQEEAVEIAEALRFPVVLGLAFETGRFARDKIELKAFDAASVQRAFVALQLVARDFFRGGPSVRVKIQPLLEKTGFEFALAITPHRQFGQVIQLGVAGPWANLSSDRLIALPPLSPPKIRQIIEGTNLFKCLGETVDFEVLRQFLTGFSRLVVEQLWIKELTINPLHVSAQGVIALDTRVILHDLETQEQQLMRGFP